MERVSHTRTAPLTALKSSYFLIYALEGALLPYLAVFLSVEHGLSPDQIGLVIALASGAVFLTPPLVSVLAEGKVPANRLLTGTMLLSVIALLAFAFADGYWWVLILFAVYGLVHEPIKPLLDGIFFTARSVVPQLNTVDFHRVRIWGTFGFMVPGVLLYFVIGQQGSLALLPFLAAGLGLIALTSIRFLPSAAPSEDAEPHVHRPSFRETVRAAITMFRRRVVALFLISMFLLQATMSAYATFYPLQATEEAGIPAQWLGIINNVGVGLELLYMAAFGILVRKLGWRWFMVIGALATALRLALLAAIPTAAVIVGTQVVHGLIIVVTMVGSRALLDRYAEDGIRHTSQGLYAMLVMGGGRIVGSALGGMVAEHSLAVLFWTAAAAALFAAGLLWHALREEHRDHVIV